jgi:hypothetical protein
MRMRQWEPVGQGKPPCLSQVTATHPTLGSVQAEPAGQGGHPGGGGLPRWQVPATQISSAAQGGLHAGPMSTQSPTQDVIMSQSLPLQLGPLPEGPIGSLRPHPTIATIAIRPAQ